MQTRPRSDIVGELTSNVRPGFVRGPSPALGDHAGLAPGGWDEPIPGPGRTRRSHCLFRAFRGGAVRGPARSGRAESSRNDDPCTRHRIVAAIEKGESSSLQAWLLQDKNPHQQQPPPHNNQQQQNAKGEIEKQTKHTSTPPPPPPPPLTPSRLLVLERDCMTLGSPRRRVQEGNIPGELYAGRTMPGPRTGSKSGRGEHAGLRPALPPGPGMARPQHPGLEPAERRNSGARLLVSSPTGSCAVDVCPQRGPA